MTAWRTLSDGRRVPISNPRENLIHKPERVVSGFSRSVCGSAPKRGKRQFSILTEQKSSAGETKCPICGEKTYFVRAKNGGSFWCDVLGIPWTPHPCMKYETYSTKVRRLVRNNLQLVGTVIKVVTPDQWDKPNLVYIKTLNGSINIVKTETSNVEGLLGMICGVMDTSIFPIQDPLSPVRLWKRNRLEDSFYDDNVDELGIFKKSVKKNSQEKLAKEEVNFGIDKLYTENSNKLNNIHIEYQEIIEKLIYYLDMIFTEMIDEKQFFRLLHKQPLDLKILFLRYSINLFDCNLKFKYKNTERGLNKLKKVKSNLKKKM